MLLQDGDKFPVTSALNNLRGQFFVDYNLLSAGSVLVALPVLILHLRAAGTSLVVDCRSDTLPSVLHWGADLGELGVTTLETLALTAQAQRPTNVMDEPVRLSPVPEPATGRLGTPGIAVHREGRHFSPALARESVDLTIRTDGTQVLTTEVADRHGGVHLGLVLELTPSGLVRLRATVRNEGPEPLTVDGLLLALPLPGQAREVLDLTGRHLRERTHQRHALTYGTHLRENRRGRTGTDASIVLVAGEPGFGFRRGQVWAAHVAWSGNHRLLAEAAPSGERLLAGGELLLPGEVRLAPGASYSSPWLYGSYGDGLDAMSGRFHDHLRSRPEHPTIDRPVTLNTWEAVYFDHGLERLRALADLADRVGAERFVLDDGWFRGRDDDHSSLGDWYVDARKWPEGLHPLVDHVRSLGLQFGLWVEPEMVWTSRGSSAPTACGPATASTPWNVRRSSGGPSCCSRPSSSAPTSAPPPRTRPDAPTRWASAPVRRSSGTWASSGT